MTATIEMTVTAAQEELARAEAAHASLLARLATDKKLTQRDLRESEDRLTFLRRRLEAVERHEDGQARAALRQGLLQLYERAVRLAGETPHLEQLARRHNVLRDDYDRAVCGNNRGVHDLGAAGMALEAKAARCGEDLDAIAAELGLQGFEWRAERLQGGVRIGDVALAKYQIPTVLGGYDPALVARRGMPPARVAVNGPSCPGSKSGGYGGRHVLLPELDSMGRPTGRQKCPHCGGVWPGGHFTNDAA